MKVSVIAIAKRNSELDNLKKALSKQTFKDYEFITSDKRGIPQAMNDAIEKANGEIIIVTESDAIPLTNTWLEEMVSAVKSQNKSDPRRRTLVRGLEVSPLPWCWCNLGCYSSVLKNNKLNTKYPMAEDTELFARLRKKGYRGVELAIAPVLHTRKGRGIWKSASNSFTYGRLLTRITLDYGHLDFKTERKDSGNIVLREIGIIISRLSFMLGAFVGFVGHFMGRRQ